MLDKLHGLFGLFGLCQFWPRSRTLKNLEFVRKGTVSEYSEKLFFGVDPRRKLALLDTGHGPLGGLDLMRKVPWGLFDEKGQRVLQMGK